MTIWQYDNWQYDNVEKWWRCDFKPPQAPAGWYLTFCWLGLVWCVWNLILWIFLIWNVFSESLNICHLKCFSQRFLASLWEDPVYQLNWQIAEKPVRRACDLEKNYLGTKIENCIFGTNYWQRKTVLATHSLNSFLTNQKI